MPWYEETQCQQTHLSAKHLESPLILAKPSWRTLITVPFSCCACGSTSKNIAVRTARNSGQKRTNVNMIENDVMSNVTNALLTYIKPGIEKIPLDVFFRFTSTLQHASSKLTRWRRNSAKRLPVWTMMNPVLISYDARYWYLPPNHDLYDVLR